MTIDELIKEARVLLEKSTTGPWTLEQDGWPVCHTGCSGIDDKDYSVWTVPMSGDALEGDAKHDAAFIVFIHNLLPQILDDLERSKEENKRLWEELLAYRIFYSNNYHKAIIMARQTLKPNEENEL